MGKPSKELQATSARYLCHHTQCVYYLLSKEILFLFDPAQSEGEEPFLETHSAVASSTDKPPSTSPFV